MKFITSILICTLIFTLCLGSISAEWGVEINDDSQEDGWGVEIVPPEPPIDYSTVPTVNSSEYWDSLNTPSDIWGVAGWNTTLDTRLTVDTSASVNCSTNEVFLGNGSCYNSSLFSDGAGNLSFNQSHTDGLYANISVDVGGSNKQIQFNDGGVFNGDADFIYSKAGSGGYFSFDGTGDYVDLGNSYDDLDGVNEFTVSLWFYTKEATFDNPTGLFSRSATGQKVPWIYGKGSSSNFIFNFETLGGASDCSITSSTSAVVNTWTHLIAWWNGTTCMLYFDGVPDATTDTTINNTMATHGTDANYIGHVFGYGHFNGSIDEVMVFDSALSLAEIVSINSSGRNQGSYAGTSVGDLLGNWRADDTTANDDLGVYNGTFIDDAYGVLEANTSYIKSLTDIFLRADSEKFCWGAGDDVCSWFDGSTMVITAEVGTPDLNITGFEDVNINSDLDVLNNFTGNQIYGEMWYHNHTGTVINMVDGVRNKLFFTNSDKLNGFSFTGGHNISSNLTVQIAGTYLVNYMASGDGQNNHVYFTTVMINNTAQEDCESHKKMTAGGDIVTMSGTCLLNLNIGNDITLSTMDSGASGAGNYYSANLNLFRIGT